ncbi:MAG: hypothetical protein ACI8S6_002256 [Myxococcota bacterium]|jgi:hypothetical protein
MLMLRWLLGCRSPELPQEPIELDLPGRVVREQIEIRHDGDLLSISRVPRPIVDAIASGLMALLFPLLGIYGGWAWRSDGRAMTIFAVASVVGTDVFLIISTRHVQLLTIDRSDQSITYHYRLYIGLELSEVRRPLSEVSRIGVVTIPSEGYVPVELELTEDSGKRRRVRLGDDVEAQAVPYAEAICRYVADFADIEHIDETGWRWF